MINIKSVNHMTIKSYLCEFIMCLLYTMGMVRTNQIERVLHRRIPNYV